MATETPIDLDSLLAPIQGENPAGQDIRYTLHDAIKEARRSDDGLEQGAWKTNQKSSDWNAVISLSTEALVAKSKDIQVGIWLMEALGKKHGWHGLRDGFRLIRELLQRFWPSLYPPIEEGDLEFRAAPFEALNQSLPFTIRSLPVTTGPDSYSWFSYDESRTTENLGRKDPAQKAARVEQGKLTGEQFDKVVGELKRAFYEGLARAVGQVWDEFQQLEREVDEKFGRAAPSLLDAKKALEDCRTLVGGILVEKRKLEPDPIADAGSNGTSDDTATGPNASESRPLTIEPRSRADALKRLEAVAAFFRRTEPHSPVAYLVQRAVRWGEMPLEEWLKDVIPSDDVLGKLRDTLGIKNQSK